MEGIVPEVRVTVRYVGHIKSVVRREAEELRVPSGTSVGEVIALLEQRHPRGFRGSLLTANGTVLNHARVNLNGRNILADGGLDTRLTADGLLEILVVAPMAGGAG